MLCMSLHQLLKRLRFQVTRDVLRSVSSRTPLFIQYPQAILLKIKTPSNGRFIYPLHARYAKNVTAIQATRHVVVHNSRPTTPRAFLPPTRLS